MLSQYKQTYQNLKPEPWAPNRKVPDVSTKEVLKHWEAKSLPRSEHPCRKIVFKIKSHDQGWSSGGLQNQGTYNGSYTWFDFGLEKVSACKESEFLSPLLSAGSELFPSKFPLMMEHVTNIKQLNSSRDGNSLHSLSSDSSVTSTRFPRTRPSPDHHSSAASGPSSQARKLW